MKNKFFVRKFPCFILLLFVLFFISNNSSIAQLNDTIRLIEIGLTTDRSNTESADGAFSAEILAKSGVTAAIYNCQISVEEVVKLWAKKNHVKLLEKKSDSRSLHLLYSSKKPSGYFILDYKVTSELSKVKISFWFRTLSNVKLSGDQMGLEPLGEKLLQAIQCAPN
jgi:hypothetical protein